jgi:hypothetical protein
MRRSGLMAVPVTVLVGASSAITEEQFAPAVDHGLYESFFTTQGSDQRVRAFNGLSADRKASLMNTHTRRWLAANVDTLTGEQIAAIGEALTVLTQAAYENPSAQLQAKMAAISRRTEKLLGAEQAADAFRLRDYIPGTKRCLGTPLPGRVSAREGRWIGPTT